MRSSPGSSFARQAVETGVRGKLTVYAAAYAAEFALSLGAWWILAEAALSGRVDAAWMLAWVAGDIQRTTDGGVTGIPADAGIDKTGAGPLTQVRKCPNDDDVPVSSR